MPTWAFQDLSEYTFLMCRRCSWRQEESSGPEEGWFQEPTAAETAELFGSVEHILGGHWAGLPGHLAFAKLGVAETGHWRHARTCSCRWLLHASFLLSRSDPSSYPNLSRRMWAQFLSGGSDSAICGSSFVVGRAHFAGFWSGFSELSTCFDRLGFGEGASVRCEFFRKYVASCV